MSRSCVVSLGLTVVGLLLALLQLNRSAAVWIFSVPLKVDHAAQSMIVALGLDAEGCWALFLMMFFVGFFLGELVNWKIRKDSRLGLPAVGIALALVGNLRDSG